MEALDKSKCQADNVTSSRKDTGGKMNDGFEMFDFTEEEAEQEAASILNEGGDRDGRICICGHPAKRHATYSGIVSCSPTRLVCPCKKLRPVVETSDTRVFLRKTRGAGPSHSLSQGILAAKKKGHTVEWLIEPKCDKCGTEGKVSPVAVSQQGVIMYEATGFDVLLCQKCREE